MQFQNTRWDQQFGVFRSSPAAEVPQTTNMPFDREALTAELVKFSKSLRYVVIKRISKTKFPYPPYKTLQMSLNAFKFP